MLGPLRRVQRTERDGLRLWLATGGNQPLLVFRSGVGIERAAAAAQAVISRFAVTAIINTGFAGGLVDDLTSGTLLVPDMIVREENGGRLAYSTDRAWSDRLRVAVRAAGLAPRSEPILTSSVPLTTAAAKREAHGRLGVAAVEMEGEAVARMAATCGIPFASLRSILDPVDMDLPLPSGPSQTSQLRSLVDTTAVVLRQASEIKKVFAFANAVQQAESGLKATFSVLFSGHKLGDPV